MKTRRTTVHFSDKFSLRGTEAVLPPGDYVIVEDEELIEGLSFLAYRRVGAFIEVPSVSSKTRSMQMFPIDFADLEKALWQDIAKARPSTEVVPAT
jgi:hypothetical protein